MSVGLGIIPLVNPSVRPLKGALCCVLPPLASLCPLWGVRLCGASVSSQPRALLQEVRVCSSTAPARAQQPAGTKHLAGASLASHLKIIPSIETQAKASCCLWPG